MKHTQELFYNKEPKHIAKLIIIHMGGSSLIQFHASRINLNSIKILQCATILNLTKFVCKLNLTIIGKTSLITRDPITSMKKIYKQKMYLIQNMFLSPEIKQLATIKKCIIYFVPNLILKKIIRTGKIQLKILNETIYYNFLRTITFLDRSRCLTMFVQSLQKDMDNGKKVAHFFSACGGRAMVSSMIIIIKLPSDHLLQFILQFKIFKIKKRINHTC